MSKDTRQQTEALIKACTQQGWRVEHRKGGHYMAFPADKTQPPVAFAATPSDHRAIKNTISQMRRSGLIWPWPPKGQ